MHFNVHSVFPFGTLICLCLSLCKCIVTNRLWNVFCVWLGDIQYVVVKYCRSQTEYQHGFSSVFVIIFACDIAFIQFYEFYFIYFFEYCQFQTRSCRLVCIFLLCEYCPKTSQPYKLSESPSNTQTKRLESMDWTAIPMSGAELQRFPLLHFEGLISIPLISLKGFPSKVKDSKGVGGQKTVPWNTLLHHLAN